MNISQLLLTELGESVSVLNQPFQYMGRAEVTLDDGTKIFWLYNDNEGLLSVAPDTEELILFDRVHDEVEPSDVILYQGKEFEFNYEDAGNVTAIEGDSETEEDDRYLFTDYQSKDGQTLRLISNENTGEAGVYFGKILSEDDISEI